MRFPIGKRTRPRRRLVPAAAVAAVALIATACSNDTAGAPQTPETPAAVTEALAVVPSDVTQFWFTDAVAMRRDAGLSDVTGKDVADKKALAKYIQFTSANGLSTELDTVSPLMMEPLGFNAFDVQWQVQLLQRGKSEGISTAILKMRDDLDLAAVKDKLVAVGLKPAAAPAGSPAGTVRLDADLNNPKLSASRLGSVLIRGVTLFPEQHLLVLGRASIPAAADEAKPAPSAELIAGLPSLSLVVSSSDACVGPATGNKTTPAQRSQQAEKFKGLKPITAAAIGIGSATEAQIRVRYPNAADAEADLKARTTLMKNPSEVSQEPLADVFTGTAAASGDTITYRLTGERAVGFVTTAVLRQTDTFWAWCP